MTEESHFALLDAVAQAVAQNSRESFASLMELLRSGAVPQAAVNEALQQFEGAYYKTLADAYSQALGVAMGVQQIKALDVSGLSLSTHLYGFGRTISGEVQGIITRHAKGMHDARKLAMDIYEGYGFKGNDDPLKLDPKNHKLPKYLREILQDVSLKAQMQRIIASEQVTTIKTPALKAAYSQALDAMEKGAGFDRLAKALDIAYQERMRYFANRIAQTELHRAYSDQKAREFMAEPALSVLQIRMSATHPRVDICDLHSKLDKYGLGPGCYPKEAAPKPGFHPFCRCVARPRWDLDAANAKERPKAEQAFLLSAGENDGAKIMGSRERWFEAKTGKATVDAIFNRNKDPLYHLKRVGEVGSVGDIGIVSKQPIPEQKADFVPHKWLNQVNDLPEIKNLGKGRVASLMQMRMPDDKSLVPTMTLRGMALSDALAYQDGAFERNVAEIFKRNLISEMRSVRGVGGVAISTYNKSGAGVNIMRRVASVYPDDWVSVGNLSPVRVVVSDSRGHYIERKYSRANRRFEDTIKTSDTSTAEHEYAHHLQAKIPGLDALFQAEHRARTANDKTEKIYQHVNKETGKPDGYVERYQGREYNHSNANGNALEVMTMAFQTVLGSDEKALKWLVEMLKKDRDMLDLTVGALLHFKP